ncbi:MAG: cysteine-rich CWC family protein [Nitrospirales bacterium]
MKRRLPKTCERCRQNFICGLFGCWCRELPLTDLQYEEITKRYQECLCPTCLSELSGIPLSPEVIQLSSPTSPS